MSWTPPYIPAQQNCAAKLAPKASRFCTSWTANFAAHLVLHFFGIQWIGGLVCIHQQDSPVILGQSIGFPVSIFSLQNQSMVLKKQGKTYSFTPVGFHLGDFNGINMLNPLVTRVISHLLGWKKQVWNPWNCHFYSCEAIWSNTGGNKNKHM